MLTEDFEETGPAIARELWAKGIEKVKKEEEEEEEKLSDEKYKEEV